MPKKTNKKRRIKKRKLGSHHIALILFLIAAVVFLFSEEFNKKVQKEETVIDIIKPLETIEQPLIIPPELPTPKPLPKAKVSIIIDDLGHNKPAAQAILDIDAPLTLSILPLLTHTTWIAEEGHKRGHDIMCHIPMEATRPFELGNGGIFTSMNEDKILQTLEEDFGSVPHLIGINNHMGSAATQNERVMKIVMQKLKDEDLFFLDSITSSKTIAASMAKSMGLISLKRDIFLDNNSDPAEINKQWKKLIGIAKKRGYAIAIAHPRKNTIAFLQKTLPNNKDVELISISELIDSMQRY